MRKIGRNAVTVIEYGGHILTETELEGVVCQAWGMPRFLNI